MKTYLIFVALLLIALLPGCAVQDDVTGSSADLESVTSALEQEQESYTIQPGDQLEIKFYYNTELNASVVVRPDGNIALQLVGEVQAAGLTLTELDEELTSSYGYELLRPEITININDPQGLRIYVGGAVVRQGFIEFRNNMTPLQAVLNAGGFKDNAEASATVVIRKDPNDKPVSVVVDLAKVLAGKNSEMDLILIPNDVVYVPKEGT